MALETGTYLSSLVATNPPQSDSLTQAAGHLRLIKSTLLATFPNVTGAVTATHTELNAAAAAVAAGQYVPAGVMLDYGGSVLPPGYLWCNGAAVSRTTYAALFTAISTTHGAGDGSTTFNVPNRKDRVAIGKGDMGSTTDAAIIDTLLDTLTLGATYDGEGSIDTIALVSGNIPPHTHTISGSGTTGVESADHAHFFSGSGNSGTFVTNISTSDAQGPSSPTNRNYVTSVGKSTGSSTVSVSGFTGGVTALHAHSFSFSGTSGSTGSGTAFTVDILPPSLVVNVIIKT